MTRCIHFDKSDMPNGCTCYWDGECNHDCYYKQLKRAEKRIVDLNKTIQAKGKEYERLKQTLTEIKEIAEIHKDNKCAICPKFDECFEHSFCDDIILQKISEVKNDNT